VKKKSKRLVSSREPQSRRPRRSSSRREPQSRPTRLKRENSRTLQTAFSLLVEVAVAVEVTVEAVVAVVVTAVAVAVVTVHTMPSVVVAAVVTVVTVEAVDAADVDVVTTMVPTDTRANLVRKLTHSTASPELDVERETSRRVVTARATGDQTKPRSMVKSSQDRKKRPRSSQRDAQSQSRLSPRKKKVSPSLITSPRRASHPPWPKRKAEVTRR